MTRECPEIVVLHVLVQMPFCQPHSDQYYFVFSIMYMDISNLRFEIHEINFF